MTHTQTHSVEMCTALRRGFGAKLQLRSSPGCSARQRGSGSGRAASCEQATRPKNEAKSRSIQGAARTSYRPDTLYRLHIRFELQDWRSLKTLPSRALRAPRSVKSPVDCSSTRTPILWSMLHGSSILASRREENVQKAVFADHHGPGDSGQSHGSYAL